MSQVHGQSHICYLLIAVVSIADPPLVDMMTRRTRPVKSPPEEFSLAEVNLTFLLVIIVLSIVCLNFLIIGISVIICR